MGWFFRKKTDPDAEVRAAAAVSVWQRYAAALENFSLPINDEGELPFRKEVLEIAFPLALARAEDPLLRDALGVCYLSLANFQQLTSEERVAVQLELQALLDSRKGIPEEARGIALVIARTGEILGPVREKIAQEANARGQRLAVAMRGLA